MNDVTIGNLTIVTAGEEIALLQRNPHSRRGDDTIALDEEQMIAVSEYIYRKRREAKAYEGEQHSIGELEMDCRHLADLLVRELPKGVGFTLFTFTFGKQGSLSYISNGERGTMLSMILEWLEKVTGTDPPDTALGGKWTPEGIRPG